MKFGLPCLLAQTKQAKFFGSEATKHTSMCYNYVSCTSFPEIPRYNWNQWYRGVCVGNVLEIDCSSLATDPLSIDIDISSSFINP